MMKLKSPLFFILLLLSAIVFGQSPKQKVTDLTSTSLGFSQSVILNGHIYTVGQNQSSTLNTPIIYKQNLELQDLDLRQIMRFDSYSEEVVLSQMIKTSDNNLMLAGWSGNRTTGSIWIVKMDQNLNYIWDKSFSTTHFQEPYDMFENTTGGATILAVERTNSGSKTVQAINLDVNGNLHWAKKIASVFPNPLNEPISGLWDNNGKLKIMIGNYDNSEILFLDINGDFLDFKEYLNANGDRIGIYNNAHDANFTYYSGRMTHGSWTSIIMKVDNSDNVVWCKNIPEITKITTLTIASNGNVILAGEDFFAGRINKAIILEVDAQDGTVLKSNAFGKLPYKHDILSDILEVNGNYILSGSRKYQNVSTGYQLDLNLDLNSFSCYESYTYAAGVSKSFSLQPIAYQPTVTTISTTFSSSSNPWAIGIGRVQYNLVNTINTTVNVTGDLCNGNPDGTASIIATGGEAPYNHQWFTNNYANNYTTDSVFNLDYTNTHVVTTNDLFGCYTYDTVAIPQGTLPQPICMITVDETSTKNIISWEKPITNDIASFNIYREVAGTYGLVGNVHYDSLSQFIDVTNGVNPNITSYRYKLSVVDVCGGESELSDFHETIHMTVTQNSNSQPALIWDGYEGLTFQYYRIMRDSTNTDDWEAVDSVSNNVFTWTDVTPPTVSSRYMIEIVIDPCTSTKANTYGTTRSNRSSGNGIIYQPLVASFSETNTLIQAGQSVVYTDNSISASGNYNRAWTFEGGFPNVGNQVSEIVTYNTPGNYYTKLEVSDSVNSDVLIKTGLIEVGISGIENISAFKSVTVYPNPTKDNLSVSIDLLKSSEVIAKLYSIEGKLIEAKRNESNSSIQFSFDLSSQSKGVYLLELNTMEGKVVRKIFKK